MHHSDAPKDEEPSPKDPAEAVPPAHTQEDFPARPHVSPPQNMPVCPGINALRGRTQFEGYARVFALLAAPATAGRAGSHQQG
ncbi:hypothetical protein [Rothia aeria]|uniref:hypothetical protein n=1 Tax=Rothia aeria TaxID=172042 RepID=UPI00288A9980|nr:hypothetical protein [Rothia aeria]